MAIVLEGFDNSGKSTLAASFGLEIVHPGPRPTTVEEEDRCLADQGNRAHHPIVMDRVTCISTPMYTGKWKDKYEMSLECMIETPHCILIYCRPPIERILDFTGHVAKSYDDEQKIRWLIDNARNIVRRYDQFFEENVPHMVWDYTNPDPNVIEMAKAAQFTRGDWQRCQTLMG